MTKLSDTQAILLSAAAQREGGSLSPLPTTLKSGGDATRAINALLGFGLAEERETNVTEAVRRSDGDLRLGVFITAAGLAAIGVAPDGGGDVTKDAAVPPSTTSVGKGPSKTEAVITLLRRPEGATSAELIGATGWLPHTTRAALTGLRKKGHAIERTKRGDLTCYRMVEAV